MEKKNLKSELIEGRYKALDDDVLTGNLEGRLSGKGSITFYWRLDVGSKTYRYKIGPWDSAAPPLRKETTKLGFSRAAAVEAARAMAKLHTSEEWRDKGGYPAYDAHRLGLIEEDQQAKAEKARQALIAKQQEQNRKAFTLALLIKQYGEHLAGQGKQAAYDARNLMQNHLIAAYPALAAQAANQIEPEQFADVMRALNEQGKGRTANKLRSYLRAAYTLAARARTDPAVPLSFKGFAVRHNPLADVAVIKGANRTDKNPLIGGPFLAYWKAIETLPGVAGHILRLHLLTGGQRVAQFCRVKLADIAESDMPHMTFRDPKGKRTQARVHLVPLIDAALIEARALQALNKAGSYLVSTDGGKTPAWASTVNDYAKGAFSGMEGFTIKRIRSGVETLLSSKGISLEVRAQLQSHGLGGVQQASYDGHDYLPEKRHALQVLYTALTEVQAPKVVALGKRKAT